MRKGIRKIKNKIRPGIEEGIKKEAQCAFGPKIFNI
jgi:hypothetical protein